MLETSTEIARILKETGRTRCVAELLFHAVDMQKVPRLPRNLTPAIIKITISSETSSLLETSTEIARILKETGRARRVAELLCHAVDMHKVPRLPRNLTPAIIKITISSETSSLLETSTEIARILKPAGWARVGFAKGVWGGRPKRL